MPRREYLATRFVVVIVPKTRGEKTIYVSVCLFSLNLWCNRILTVCVSFSFYPRKRTQPAQIWVIYCIYWPYATHSTSCVCVKSSVYEITFLRDRFLLPHYLLTCYSEWGRVSNRPTVRIKHSYHWIVRLWFRWKYFIAGPKDRPREKIARPPVRITTTAKNHNLWISLPCGALSYERKSSNDDNNWIQFHTLRFRGMIFCHFSWLRNS